MRYQSKGLSIAGGGSSDAVLNISESFAERVTFVAGGQVTEFTLCTQAQNNKKGMRSGSGTAEGDDMDETDDFAECVEVPLRHT